ncbi:MAG: hypothetical protein HY360_14375, partial [Verrucomicrobia bacterium]|nr:hypothetical protein [Verrucomicrobiota bacterium]
MKPNKERVGLANRRVTREEQMERREQITVLRYDLGLSEREIAKQLGMSLGRVSEELREINKEFNKPLDPSPRDSVIQEHDRQHRQVMGKLWQCFTTAVD